MSDGKSESSARASVIPSAVAFPLLVIAVYGCFEGGCQGALDAQSKALHQAYVAGGWEDSR
jgi:hypothetical protein